MAKEAKTNNQVVIENKKKDGLNKTVESLTREAEALRSKGWGELAKETERKLARIKRRAAAIGVEATV